MMDSFYRCKRCDEDKDYDSFPKDPRCKLGINLVCKECYNERRRNRYKEDTSYRSQVVNRQKRYIKSGYYRKGFCSNAKEINDTYAIQAIRRGRILERQDIPQDLIDSVKELLKVKRLTRQLKHEYTQQQAAKE